ncbi:sensor histidine kinase [Tenacibaculum agarivorans]|uniref:sensor histidine kinase n=1 Tax=Tenacibaculum agarivorans TaxID=1908389 RepID=UPI00135635C4|nr:histidine kinase [Tenacibaculum agarivorans]
MLEKTGYPNVEIYDIEEDDKGYIWLATDRGLLRYDGKLCKRFDHPNKLRLSVFNLVKDNRGRIWCNNLSDQFFYVEEDKLHLLVDLEDQFSDIPMLSDFIVSGDTLKITNVNKTLFIDIDTKEITYKREYVNHMYKNPSILEYSDATYVILDSLYQIQNKTNIARGFAIDFKNKLYNRLHRFNNQLYCFQSITKHPKDSKIQYEEVLHHVDIESGITSQNKLPNELQDKYINSIKKIEDQFWFCTNEGLYVYDFDGEKYVFKEIFFKNKYVVQVIEDYMGRVVVATLKSGLFMIPNKNIRKEYLTDESKKTAFIFFHKHYMFYAREKGKITMKNIITNDSKTIDLSNEIGKIYWGKKINKNRIYISGSKLGVFWDLTTNMMFVAPGGINKDINYRKLDDTFFISGYDLLYTQKLDFNIKINSTFTPFKPKLLKRFIANLPDSILHKGRSWFNFISSDQYAYASFGSALYEIDHNLVTKELKYNGESIQTNSCAETTDKTIWIASLNYGLLKKDTNGTIENIKNIDSKKVLQVVADQNDLWILDEKNLNYLNTTTNTILKFNLRNELLVNKVKAIQAYRDKLYVLGTEELVTIDKSVVHRKIIPSKVFVQSVAYGDKKYPLKKKYVISHDQNQVEIYFKRLGYNTEEDKFEYRLLNLDEKWKITKQDNVKYSYIPHGNYTFQIRAINQKNVTIAYSQDILITIEKPYWLQWWFIGGSIIVVLLSFYGVIWRIRKNQKVLFDREKLSKELIFSKLENLRSQMNPHFIFNTLNSIQGYIITNKKEEASIYLAEFSELMRMYLDFSSKEFTMLLDEIKAIEVYLKLERVRIGESFNYSINSNVIHRLGSLTVPSLFLQPYIENSIIHGLVQKDGEKKLSITFDYDNKENSLICSIDDNGIGREKASLLKKKKNKYHKSYALKANDNRLDLLNKNRLDKVTIEIVDKKSKEDLPEGTTVIIKIPQEYESYID